MPLSLSTLRAMSDEHDDSTSQSAYTTSADESDVSDLSTSTSAGFYFHGLYFPLRNEEAAEWVKGIDDKGVLLMMNRAMRLMKSWSDLKSLRSLLAFRTILRIRFNADTARQIVECLLPYVMISRASERAECETRAVT